MEMETEFTSGRRTNVAISDEQTKPNKRRNLSIFEVPSNFFDSCRFIECLSASELTTTSVAVATTESENSAEESEASASAAEEEETVSCRERWTCNTCKNSFESLHDQRSHFKSDFHRFNIQLSIAGKDTVEEDDYDELASNSLVKDYDISSISSSEDEDIKEFGRLSDLTMGSVGSTKPKCFVHLPNGEMISFWKCLILGDSEKILFEHDLCGSMKDDDDAPCVTVMEVSMKLLNVIHEPRDNKHLRVILLATGGHFAGCVFDGNNVVAHRTFHRYVIRAKAGKKQSSQDASGKTANSAGASIRRHNELALKKDIRELLAAWKPYFDQSSCIFIHAPSHNRKLLFNGENPYFSCKKSIVRHIPLTVQRPTFKEAQRLYKILTQISIEPDEKIVSIIEDDSTNGQENLKNDLENWDISEDCFVKKVENFQISLPLHEAAKAGNVEKVLELLEQGLDPCVIDVRGRTAYRVAAGKEVRNTFRRFMALNLDKWDWQAAKVPCPLTKDMEESQNAKQAKKDAKRKAKAKELKLLRKAKEKKAQLQEGVPCNHQGTHRISSRVARVIVLVIGSLLVVAFGQKVRGRTRKNAR